MAGKRKDDSGSIDNDRYRAIMGDEKAQIEMLVGHTIGFGDAKVHVAVRLTCNQDENTIFEGGNLAYQSAKELVEAALNDILPPPRAK